MHIINGEKDGMQQEWLKHLTSEHTVPDAYGQAVSDWAACTCNLAYFDPDDLNCPRLYVASILCICLHDCIATYSKCD